MQVILLSRVRNLGDLGDTVKVRAGYGRNYLIPKGIALPANKDNVAAFEARKAELVRQAQDSLNAAKIRHQAIDGKEVTIGVLASEEGRLYGSITASQIAQAAADAGIELEAKEISLDAAIRDLGDYTAMVALHPDVEAQLTVKVVAQATA